MASLSQLLPGTESGDTALFHRGGRYLTLARMRRDSARLTARLRKGGVRHVLLHADDLYAFAVGFLSAFHAGADVILPPNAAPATLQALLPAEVGVLVSDIPLPGAWPVLPEDGEDAEDSSPEAALQPFDPHAAMIFFSTSGSSGEPKTLLRSLANLEAEVEAVRVFGPEDGGSPRVFSTVSPMHAYGIIFCCLLPLARGWCVECLPLCGVEGVLRAMDAYDGLSWLVSSPAFLSLWTANLALYPLKNPPDAVVSAGAPLPGAVAEALIGHYDVTVNEVFGSTETGVTAHRHRPGDPWTPFPGVQIEPFEGGIHVTSPEVGGCGTCDLGDAIEVLPGGRFKLLGRVDRIVKLADKRLSLAEVEARLTELPEVEAAAAMVVKATGRPRLGVAVVPSDEGMALLAKEGYAGMSRHLRRHLARHFDPVLLPRKWRFTGALPLNTQSKVDRAALSCLFDEQPLLPVCKPLALTSSVLEFRLLFVPDTPCYAGHFPGYPIVPGVLFLHTLSRLLERYCHRRVSGVTRYKFCAEVHPGELCRLRIALQENEVSLTCTLEPDGSKCSTGRIATKECK